MKIFLAGISNVGKTTIGACLAKRLRCAFYDLDHEIEKHFGKPIARLRAEAGAPRGFRKQFASVVLADILQSERNSSFVMALLPSGLMDSTWAILKNVDRVVVALRDSPQNILSRITFYDDDSDSLVKELTEMERAFYLREIRKDATYFGRSFRNADVIVDIDGLGVDGSAAKIERLVREWGMSATKLLDALDYAETVKAIRKGLEDVENTRTQPAKKAFAEIRKNHAIARTAKA